MHTLEDKTFILLIAAVSAAFAWVLWPFYGAVLWAVVVAILFIPIYRRLLRRLRQRPTLAALVTVGMILVVVILPFTLLVASIVRESAGLYQRFHSGELNAEQYFEKIVDVLPAWAVNLLHRFEIANVRDVQQRLSTGLMEGSQFIASQAQNLGQNTFDFVVSLFIMLYLLFFLLRDGDELAARISEAIPLRPELRRHLLAKFTIVIRATVKGNIIVALAQGALGGLIFWILGISPPLLWGALMAFLSLLPAVGAGIIWLPVALYLFATGAVLKGIVLLAFGVLVIGLVDNVLRPVLVGKDTKMPDYVVLISTLGGIAVFGLNGFVIGPVIAAMFMASWDIFSTSNQQLRQRQNER